MAEIEFSVLGKRLPDRIPSPQALAQHCEIIQNERNKMNATVNWHRKKRTTPLKRHPKSPAPGASAPDPHLGRPFCLLDRTTFIVVVMPARRGGAIRRRRFPAMR